MKILRDVRGRLGAAQYGQNPATQTAEPMDYDRPSRESTTPTGQSPDTQGQYVPAYAQLSPYQPMPPAGSVTMPPVMTPQTPTPTDYPPRPPMPPATPEPTPPTRAPDVPSVPWPTPYDQAPSAPQAQPITSTNIPPGYFALFGRLYPRWALWVGAGVAGFGLLLLAALAGRRKRTISA